jgi:hypothetical protein
MPTLYQPIILEADYEIFQALLKNKLPPTYREWLVEQRSDIDVWIALWQDARREEIIRVVVSPVEFNAWCKVTNNIPSRLALTNFAETKANK